MPTRRFAVFCALLSVTAFADDKVTYNDHIRPILANNCFACHGTDAAHRKAKLRLDTAAGATAERDGTRAIVPGDPEKSELWQRIISSYEDEVMPPADSHKKPLEPKERELIKRWIQQGAVYQNHWAYEPVARAPVPSGKAAGKSANPVDRFISARLAAERLALAPEAPREVLIRRLTLDLTGLPPTPDEVDAFVADRSAGAYERVVERLLASPRYGEHFGRYWLDAVRYADTHGLHLDNVRIIWPYRDWVVSAFNRNLPFDQFTIEQLAGDMLPQPRIDQLVASGYNRNHLSTSEGGAIEAEAEMRNTADRVDTTSAVWMGLTANCASCHDHKFDPLTQKEYYSLGAIFKGLADRVWDGNVRVAGPVAILAKDEAAQRRVDAVNASILPLEAAVSARADALVAGELPMLKLDKKPITYDVVWAEDSELPTPADIGAAPKPGEWREGAGVPVVGGKRALRMEGRAVRPFAFTAGDVALIVRTEAKAYVHVHLDPANPPRAISLEFISDEKKTRRIIWGDPQAFEPEFAANAIRGGALPAPGKYAQLALTACESGLQEGKAYTGIRIGQSDGVAWWDRVGAVYTSPSGSDDPLLSKDAWVRSLQNKARAFESMALRHDINFLIGLSSTQQTAEEKQRVVRFHRDYIYAPLRAALEPEVHAARRLMAEQMHYETTLPMTPISRELAEPREARVLVRGQYDKPGEVVQAGTPAFLPPIAFSGARPTRLDFARWLVSPQHPLTSRVTVNRMWGQIFGAGLVRTPADFGVQGESPTHPELLNWLAAEFMATGWDVKKFVRLLVTSETYRQNSGVSPALLERDPENKLLARGPRLRLDAEVLRDQMLALGGLLRPEIGGPPVRPYQPVNIWEPVAFGGSNTKTYVQEHGDALYRRSLYTFAKRTAPAPSLSTFDAPSRENFCVLRTRSNTPLQALALMNDVQNFEAARAFAERLLTRTSSDDDRLAYAFKCVTARPPVTAERALLKETLATHRTHFAQNLDAAQQVLTNGESKPSATLPVGEFAAWTMVANLLFNLDETVTRN
ncbi:PSD1 and planctomycete cytochrome C domain-containing protein [Horticoccus sp. 23ND18S-11]|uniref:PSD1 and planctomycete cytochrome C domain-containing protein n=1 Tax=Horticoccus sp. 23ND18S-11 TaxID=3391832 RepID=UPI0039C967A3